MLSRQLLALLRLRWKEGKRRSVMLPHGWLFPELSATDPISTRQINRAIHEAAEAAGSLCSLRHPDEHAPSAFSPASAGSAISSAMDANSPDRFLGHGSCSERGGSVARCGNFGAENGPRAEMA